MSRHEWVEITCPVCGQKSEFMIWSSINTSLDPDMKEKVLNGEAFTFTCPNCNGKTGVDYGTLYHQMEDHIMIFYAISDENEKEILDMLNRSGNSEVEKLMNRMFEDDYLIRIVRSQNSLREKIRIFDSGLDDRLIEISKIYIWAMYNEKNPDSKDVEMFYSKVNDQDSLVIFDEKKNVASANITKDFYDSLARDYGGGLTDIRKDTPIIDGDWAFKMFKQRKQEI